MQVTVTQKRRDKLLSSESLCAVMDGDMAAILHWMPFFISDGAQYVGRVAGRVYLGGLTLRAFTEAVEKFKDDLAVTPHERQMIAIGIQKPVATMPGWTLTLDAAKDWGLPPWEVAQDNQREFWFRRYRIVEQLRRSKGK